MHRLFVSVTRGSLLAGQLPDGVSERRCVDKGRLSKEIALLEFLSGFDDLLGPVS